MRFSSNSFKEKIRRLQPLKKAGIFTSSYILGCLFHTLIIGVLDKVNIINPLPGVQEIGWGKGLGDFIFDVGMFSWFSITLLDLPALFGYALYLSQDNFMKKIKLLNVCTAAMAIAFLFILPCNNFNYNRFMTFIGLNALLCSNALTVALFVWFFHNQLIEKPGARQVIQ